MNSILQLTIADLHHSVYDKFFAVFMWKLRWC